MAQLLDSGRRLLEVPVAHADQRRQYSAEIGRFQTVNHLLSEVSSALEPARPLLHGVAATTDPTAVSAAKVACDDAAHLSARTTLEVHGEIDYTAEHPLGLRQPASAL
ncbi:acyl-CoA dehydrogenase family protein [Amycolatopsis sp. PS_44_ISF1]|nr:acyl-CoA dehydrogenase family protein [Amycolatopsis sp. PS_44_ISF1]MDT8914172.1 acyl-CoA dehydrogenase family protein [Amycolatopsis sp. PS_44_ISF1]